MHILIIGGGAVGSYIGAKLGLSGQQVTIVGRPAYVESVGERGLIVTEQGATHAAPGVRAVASLADAFRDSADRYDFACLTVKSYDTVAAAEELAKAAAAPPPVVTLQNGVGNEEKLIQPFGAGRVVAGTITASLEIVGHGEIVAARTGSINLSPTEPGQSLSVMETTFRQADLRVRVSPDYRSLKWSKLLLNIMGNATSAILDWSPRQIFADRRLCALELRAVREGLAVMRAQSIRPVSVGQYPVPVIGFLLQRFPVPMLQPLLRRTVGAGRGHKMPSLHIDLSRGRSRSEVEVLNGAIADEAARLGVDASVNERLRDVLLHIARNELPWDEFRAKPEHLLNVVCPTLI